MRTRLQADRMKRRPKAKTNPNKRKELKKVYAQVRRERIKLDPAKYEEQKAKDRERKKQAREEGKSKQRDQMTPRELTLARRTNRKQVQKYRDKKRAKLAQQQTSESEFEKSDAETQSTSSSRSAGNIDNNTNNGNITKKMSLKRRGRKKKEARRSTANRVIEKQSVKIKGLERKVDALQKQINRTTTNKSASKRMGDLSPKSQTERILNKEKVSPGVRKQLLFGQVLKSELRNSLSSLKKNHEKLHMHKLVSGRVCKQYRLLKDLQVSTSLTRLRFSTKKKLENTGETKRVRPKSSDQKQSAVENFFLNNRISSEMPGKKNGRLYDGVQRQRRYLHDEMKPLYKRYVETESVIVSYATFCRYRPKWVVSPKLSERDSCLCVRCENFNLMMKAVKTLKLLENTDKQSVLHSLCCDPSKPLLECTLRKCKLCMQKKLEFLPGSLDRPVMYSKWINDTIEKQSYKDQDKLLSLKVMKKTDKYCTAGELITDLDEYINSEMSPHWARNCHQKEFENHLKNTIQDNEMIFNVDWSQNYVGKYGQEPQSVHFGASHTQIALHTGRVYCRGFSQSFCTLSECTRHDYPAILAHLKPIMEKYLEAYPNVEHLHFQTDGPTSQYRNRNLYGILFSFIADSFPQVKRVTWHYSEAGHGKNEADGVGGILKRTADKAVAFGKDINDLTSLVELLTLKVPSVDLFIIPDTAVYEAAKIEVPVNYRFNGIMSVHSFLWQRESRHILKFKTLSCIPCPRSDECNHFSIGKPWSLGTLSPKESAPKPKKPAAQSQKKLVVPQPEPRQPKMPKKLPKHAPSLRRSVRVSNTGNSREL